MRTAALMARISVACVAVLAIAAACSGSTSQGSARPSTGIGDGGTSGGGADGGMGGMAHDMGQGASTAAQDVGSAASQGAHTAGQTMADAGSSAMDSTRDTASSAAQGASGAASDTARGVDQGASSAANTASDAARSAASGASSASGSDAGGGGQLTDAQIVAVAKAANDVDIAGGKLAARKTKNAKVREFANLMVKDHGSANKQALALVKKLGVTPEESDQSRALKQAGAEESAKLKTMSGKDFDTEYVNHEVDYHQQVLKALDDTLIPNAQNEQLKALLTKVRGVVQDHLEHAKSLQSSLGGT